MENRRTQLAVTVEERETQIKMHKELLQMELKTAEEERRRISVELRERLTQVGHLRNRFQVLINRIHKDEDDPEGEMTHAQYIVKTAKEREELQARGDELDEEIKKLEIEAKKLDKTINILKGCNSEFKGQFKKANPSDPEVQTKSVLETQRREVQTVLSRRTTEMKEYLKAEMGKMTELQDAQREQQELQHKINILRDGLEGVRKNSAEYRSVTNRLNTAIGKLRANTAPEIVRDIALYEARERNSLELIALSNIVQQNGSDDLHRYFVQLLHHHGLEVPAQSEHNSVSPPPLSLIHI